MVFVAVCLAPQEKGFPRGVCGEKVDGLVRRRFYELLQYAVGFSLEPSAARSGACSEVQTQNDKENEFGVIRSTNTNFSCAPCKLPK